MRGAQRIRAGIMAQIEAELLQAEVGAPLLIIERRCYLADGRPVEFTETRYNGAVYDFLTDLGAENGAYQLDTGCAILEPPTGCGKEDPWRESWIPCAAA